MFCRVREPGVLWDEHEYGNRPPIGLQNMWKCLWRRRMRKRPKNMEHSQGNRAARRQCACKRVVNARREGCCTHRNMLCLRPREKYPARRTGAYYEQHYVVKTNSCSTRRPGHLSTRSSERDEVAVYVEDVGSSGTRTAATCKKTRAREVACSSSSV